MKRKKLIFITSRLLWPIDSGRKMSLNYYCKGLHEKFGYDIYLYSFLESGQVFNGVLPNYIKEIRIAKNITLLEKIKNIIFYTFGKKKWPFQCSLFYSKKNMKEICKYCEKIKPDVIFTEMIRTSQYIDFFKRFDAINISNLDDLLSKRYERQALSIKRVTNIAGIYSSKLPKLLDRLIKNVNFKKSILKFESKRCDIWEKKFYKEFDYIMFTSPLETNEMNVKMCDQKAITLSVGVDYDLFAKPLVSVEKEKNSMSYVGNFRVASNCDTLRMICNEILPKVQHEYKFYVVGLCPDEIRNTYKNNSRIIFCGRVENLVEIVQKTEVFFSPILYGTGIKTKIIEAMAMGMPVITNDVGVEGINAKDGIHLIIENEYDNLVKSLVVLLDDSKLRNKIGLNAQSFVNEFFRWDVIYNAFNLIGL